MAFARDREGVPAIRGAVFEHPSQVQATQLHSFYADLVEVTDKLFHHNDLFVRAEHNRLQRNEQSDRSRPVETIDLRSPRSNSLHSSNNSTRLTTLSSSNQNKRARKYHKDSHNWDYTHRLYTQC